MSIELVTFDTERRDTSWDVKRKKWISYRIDVRVNGKRHRDRFPNKKKAEAFIEGLQDKKKRNKVGIPATHSYTLKELFEKRKQRLDGKELIRAKRIFRTFIELNGNLPAQSVTKQHFQVYVNSRLEDVKPSTVNREITVLSPCFKNASELFADLELTVDLARAKDRKRRTFKRTISKADMLKIVHSILTQRLKKERFQRRNARPHFARMFEVAWMLGLRFSEIRGFRPDDLTGDVLIVRRAKTDTVTEMKYLPPRVIELLKEGPFELCSEHTTTDILKQACIANGIPYGRDGMDSITFHTTRHSFTTRMSQVTDIATTASFTGHSDKEMVAYYSHASDESQRVAMERMYGSSGLEEVFEQVRNGQMSLENFTRWAQTHQNNKA